MSSTWSTAQKAARRCSPLRASAGVRTVDGLEVLVAQGALSLELWTGRQRAARGHAPRCTRGPLPSQVRGRWAP